MAARQTFSGYIAAAFKIRWNILFVTAGTIAAAISGHADVALPLLAAAEIAYLGFIGTNPRFHRAIDAQIGAAQSAASSQAMRSRFDELYRGLDAQYRKKFDSLRQRCVVLADLAGREGADKEDLGVGDVAQAQLAGVNKLLWVYLKLLHTKATMERFFQQIDPAELDRLEKDARQRLEELPTQIDAGPLADLKRKSIQDTLATVAARRENIQKARENHDYVSLELERIEKRGDLGDRV